MIRVVRKVISIALLILVTISFIFSKHQTPSVDITYSSPHHQSLPPANSTLNFGTVLAVSRPNSPRRPGLLWAADLTSLSITIPPQPPWNTSDISALRSNPFSQVSTGSALAWLGHLHALHSFLSTNHETALIIEDDVDFDISIRTHQIPLFASFLRPLLSSSSWSTGGNPGYWGDANAWDILYPGHCDDLLPSSSNNFLSHPYVVYKDPTTPLKTQLHPDTAHFLRAVSVSEGERILHRSFAPFCTFAYAVTRRSARRIVMEYSKAAEGIGAFDEQLLRACRERLRCWSVAPELFHHVGGGSEIAGVDLGSMGGDAAERGEGGDKAGVEMEVQKGAWNVRCGARHGELWVEEGDEIRREEARRVVRELLRRGECPLDLARAERGWRGCEWSECGAQS